VLDNIYIFILLLKQNGDISLENYKYRSRLHP